MELQLNEEHLQVHHVVRGFLQQTPASPIRRLERQHVINRTSLRRPAASGLLAVVIPRRYSGIGEDYRSIGLEAEELEEHDSALRETQTQCVPAGLRAFQRLPAQRLPAARPVCRSSDHLLN